MLTLVFSIPNDMNLLQYLKQTCPKAEKKWRTIVFISLFVMLFLFLFQPFGISQIGDVGRKCLFIGGFGLVSFVVLVFDLFVVEYIFSGFFKEKNWCVYKELFWLLCVVSSIGFGNVLYVVLVWGSSLSLANLINFQLLTFAVALFPICLLTIVKQNYFLKMHTTSAKYVNDALTTTTVVHHDSKDITVYSYNEKASETFDLDKLYYVESRGNEIELNLYEDDRVVSKKLRNTLKNTLTYFEDSAELVQCHRAFIVNLDKVSEVEGNSQGLLLKFANSDAEVPVSRTYVPIIKQLLS